MTTATATQTMAPREYPRNARRYPANPGAAVAAALRRIRIEAGFEQAHQVGGEGRMGGEHALHVHLAEWQAGLQQIAAVGAQYHQLAHGQRRGQQQAVEAVVLDLAAPAREYGLDEARLDLLDVECQAGAVLEFEVLDVGAAGDIGQRDPPRALRHHPQAEVLHHRQQVGDRDRLAGLDDAEMQA